MNNVHEMGVYHEDDIDEGAGRARALRSPVRVFRGWFAVSSHRGSTERNKVKVSLTVDPDKMNDDAEKVKERTAELTGQVMD